jgi:pimeloyl-ACP methyl ester carboxylesterase
LVATLARRTLDERSPKEKPMNPLDPSGRGGRRHDLRRTVALVAAVLALGSMPAATAAAVDAYDPEATNFAYPYPVHFFEFESQRQPLRMAYLDVAPEKPNGRAVVLLHGKNFHAGTWATTIASLQRAGFRVIAPDQLGFGKSSKPERYQFSFTQLAANTRALLASLGIDRSVVVGHSMGGMLAVRYAVAYPAATERLVLVNPIGLEDYAALIPPRTVDDWYRQELDQTPEKVREYQRTAYYGGQWKPEYEEHTRLLAGWTRHPDYRRVAWDSALLYDMILTQPVVHDLPRLRVPTRLIIGTRDRTALGRPFATPEVQKTMGDYTTLGKRAQRQIPSAELVEIPGVGHVPQVEAFPAFEKALLEFLR